MRYPEEELIAILKKAQIEFLCTLPCDRIRNFITLAESSFIHIPLTREEEGVGICAGMSLTGARSAMFFQNSGIGNMINALLSLTGFYRLPLALFISHRGVYKEKIEAQKPMGKHVPAILKGAGIPFSMINSVKDFRLIREKLPSVFRKKMIHAFLLSPSVWEWECGPGEGPLKDAAVCSAAPDKCRMCTETAEPPQKLSPLKPVHTRYEILKAAAPFLEGKVVVCNIGFPARELYSIRHQLSNFYMLGSMGMATPIGLGIALTAKKKVVVIDGDGSLLMNPGTLATCAHFSPKNLTILAIDNGAYGSTGNQPTFTVSCVDLEVVARGFGFRNTRRVVTEKQLVKVLNNPVPGMRFIHVLARPGNADVPVIPLSQLRIRDQVQRFLREDC